MFRPAIFGRRCCNCLPVRCLRLDSIGARLQVPCIVGTLHHPQSPVTTIKELVMPGIFGVVTLLALFALSGEVLAQGTRDPRSGAADSNAATRSRGAGIGTMSTPDTMGGAFRGTGVPNLGTSPGMGSDPVPRRN